MNLPINGATVFAAALLTALATGLGAVPFLFRKSFRTSTLGAATAAAAGLMTAAALLLGYEGLSHSVGLMLAGALLGCAFVELTVRRLEHRPIQKLGNLKGVGARQALAAVIVMTAHSAAEGIGVGVSYGGGDRLGVFITAAIAVHNIPEGLAISLVMVPRGARVASAAAWSVFSSLPQPLLAVPAYYFVASFASILPAGMGFAAGAMIWMAAAELLPEALRQTGRGPTAVAALTGLTLMALLQWALSML